MRVEAEGVEQSTLPGLFDFWELAQTEVPLDILLRKDAAEKAERAHNRRTKQARREFLKRQISILAYLDNLISAKFPALPMDEVIDDSADANKVVVRKVGFPKGAAQNRSTWELPAETLKLFRPNFPTDLDLVEVAESFLLKCQGMLETTDPLYARGRFEEIDWVFSESMEGFSFSNCCLLIGIDPNVARGSLVYRGLVPPIEDRALWYLNKHREVLKQYATAKIPPAEAWEAFEWVNSRSNEVFSFEDCAQLVGINANELREEIIGECEFLDGGYARFAKRRLAEIRHLLTGSSDATEDERRELVSFVLDRDRSDGLSFRELCRGAEVDEEALRVRLIALSAAKAA